jgi:alpha-L-fucosidase
MTILLSKSKIYTGLVRTFSPAILTALGVAIGTPTSIRQAAGATPSPAAPALSSPSTEPSSQGTRMAWFRQAKYGLFIHWGLYAIPGGVWKGKAIRPSSEWIMAHAKIPVKEYEALASQFNPQQFNADHWAQMAQDAGMRYIVITAKHGDGFAMYHSLVTPYNIVDATPFKRDPCLELAQACTKHGLKFGIYYSQTVDWHEAGGEGNSWDFGRDADKEKSGAWDKYLQTKVEPQLKELLTRYGPICEIFFDTPSKMMTAPRAKRLKEIVNSLQPDCLIDGRLADADTGVTGDYLTMGDNGIPNASVTGDWETPGELNHNWGFDQNDSDYKSPSEVLAILLDVASKGGNYLLDVGPTAQGTIPVVARENLLTVGRWLKVNGEAVYGVGRSPFGEGFPGYRKVVEAGGRTVNLPFADWRCTSRPGKLYFTVFHWSSPFKLPAFKNDITKAYLLSDPTQSALEVTGDAEHRVITVPHYAPNVMATVIVVEIKGNAAEH